MDATLRNAERALSELLARGFAVDVAPDGPWVRATLRGAGMPAGSRGLVYRAAPTVSEALDALAEAAQAL